MGDDLVSELDTAISLWCGGGGSFEEAVFGASRYELFELSEVLALISRHYNHRGEAKNERFSFTANSALSGGSHPCASPDCRTDRIQSLMTFAALYADEVYIQQPFEHIALRGPDSIKEVDRHNIVAGLYNYKLLRPFFEKGVIRFAHEVNPFCDHHYATVAEPLAKKIDQKAAELAAHIERVLLDTCSVTFNQSNPEAPFFEISGPEGTIEHGRVYYHAYKPFPKAYRRFSKKGVVHSLSKSEIQDSGVLQMVVDPIIRDITFQEWHTTLTGTSYLSDSSAHMALVSAINGESFAAHSDAFAKGLKHYLPRVYARDPITLLKLRDRESEAFAVYRDKLTKLLRKSDRWSDKEVAEAFRDEVLPEIHGIEKRVRDWKSNSRDALGEKVIFGAGAVTLGLYAGILPADVGQLVAALGGGSAAAGVLMDWNKTFKEKQQARTSDFFFLWEAAR